MGAGLDVNKPVRETRGTQNTHSPEFVLQKIARIIHEHSYLPMQSALLRDFLRRGQNRSILFDYFQSSDQALKDLVNIYQPVLCFFSPQEQKILYRQIEFFDLDEQMDFSIRMEVRSKIGDLVRSPKK
jgi:hypothetical protein